MQKKQKDFLANITEATPDQVTDKIIEGINKHWDLQQGLFEVLANRDKDMQIAGFKYQSVGISLSGKSKVLFMQEIKKDEVSALVKKDITEIFKTADHSELLPKRLFLYLMNYNYDLEFLLNHATKIANKEFSFKKTNYNNSVDYVLKACLQPRFSVDTKYIETLVWKEIISKFGSAKDSKYNFYQAPYAFRFSFQIPQDYSAINETYCKLLDSVMQNVMQKLDTQEVEYAYDFIGGDSSTLTKNVKDYFIKVANKIEVSNSSASQENVSEIDLILTTHNKFKGIIKQHEETISQNQNKITSLRKELDKKDEEIQLSKQASEKLGQSNKSLNAEKDKFIKRIESLNKEIEESKLRLAMADGVINQIQGEHKQYGATLEKTIADAKKTIISLKQEVDNKSRELNISRQVSASAQDKLELSDSIIKNLTAEKGELNKKIESINKDLEEVNAKLEQVNNNAKDLNAEKEGLNKRITALNKNKDSLIDQIKNLKVEIEASKKSNTGYEEKIKSLDGNIVKLKNQLEASQKNETEARKSLESQILDSKAKLEEYSKSKKEAEDLRAQIKELETNKNKIVLLMNNGQTELLNLKQKHEEVVKKNKSFEDKLKLLNDELLALKSKLDIAEQEKIKLTNCIEDSKNETGVLKNKIESLENENRTLKSQIDITQQASEAKAQRTKHVRSDKKLLREKQKLTARVHDLETENVDLKSKLADSDKQKQENLELLEEIKKLRANIADMQSSSTSAPIRILTRATASTSTNSSLNENNAVLVNQLKSEEAKPQNLEAELSKVKAQQLKFKNETARVIEEYKSRDVEFKKRVNELEQYSQPGEIAIYKLQNKELIMKVKQQEAEIAKLSHVLTHEKQKFDIHTHNLESAITFEQHKNSTLLGELRVIERSNIGQKAEIIILNNAVLHMQAKISYDQSLIHQLQASLYSEDKSDDDLVGIDGPWGIHWVTRSKVHRMASDLLIMQSSSSNDNQTTSNNEESSEKNS